MGYENKIGEENQKQEILDFNASEKMKKEFNWTFNKMVKDEDTAYDEVIGDLGNIVRAFVSDKKAEILALDKLNQLERLIDGGR